MTLFQLVKIALDELYKEAEKTYGAKTDEEIKARFTYLTDSYSKLYKADRKPVDYKDPATRFAYVYKYVAVGADSNLSHRADRILSQGWKPTLRWSAVDKCSS